MKTIVLVCAAFLVAGPVFSQEDILFEATLIPSPRMVYEQEVELDAEGLTENPDSFVFTLDTDVEYRAHRLNFQQIDAGWFSWSGFLTDVNGPGDHGGNIKLTYFQGRVSGLIHVQGGSYMIQPGPQSPHRLIRMRDDGPWQLEESCDLNQCDENTTCIDVMALYTRSFLESAAETRKAEAYIKEGLCTANEIFANQDHDSKIQYRLVYMGPTPTNEPVLPSSDDIAEDLCDLALLKGREYLNGPAEDSGNEQIINPPQEITLLREAYGADMVALFIPHTIDNINGTESDQCGFANAPRKNDDGQEIFSRCDSEDIWRLFKPEEEPFVTQAFSVMEVGCGQSDFTVAHELGHNFGIHHQSGGGIKPVEEGAFGHLLDLSNKLTTLMRCEENPGSAVSGVCRRIPFFSDLKLTYGFLGTESSAGTANANAVKVVGNRASQVANFMAPSSNETPTLTITSPADGISVMAGTQITFTASANDTEDGNLEAIIEWFSNKEQLDGMGTPFSTQLFVDEPQVITAVVTDSGGKRVEQSIRVEVTPIIHDVNLVASYVPRLNQPRTTFSSSSDNPPEFEYYYDPNLGNFEQRPGGACPNPNGAENPTYLKISLGGSILNQGGIDDCSFGASWDNGQVFPCNGVQIAALNSGQETIIGTDDYRFDPATCEEFFPLQSHVAYNELHYFKVNFVVDGVTYPRRIKFRRTSEVLRLQPVADTFAVQLAPTSNFGGLSLLQVRSSATGDGRFAFMRFNARDTDLQGTRGSARVRMKVLSRPINFVDFHRVCNGSWGEFQLTWNNWGQLTGGSCGIVETRSNLPAKKIAYFDAGTQPFTGVVNFGAATLDTGFGRAFSSREATKEGDRPLLLITIQRN